MSDSIQFSVTRTGQNTYRVIVQDEKQIIRTADVNMADVLDKLGYELEQLKSKT